MKVTLSRLWLTPVSDPTQARSFRLNDTTQTPSAAVDSRRGAGGNFYAVVMPGVQQSATATLNFCTDDDVAWLRTWLALPVCYRDPRGLKFYGYFTPDSFHPRFMGNSWTVTLTVVEVTISEDVTA